MKNIEAADEMGSLAAETWGREAQWIALAGEAGELAAVSSRCALDERYDRDGEHEEEALLEIVDVLIVALSLFDPGRIDDAIPEKLHKLREKIARTNA